MLAARWHGRHDVRIDNVPEPASPGPGWVRLAVEACGICGTDVEEYSSGPLVVPTTPNRLTGACAPLTLGHEAVGVVTEAGAGVALAVGTRVAVEANMFCGTCFWCLRHEYPLCPSLCSLGLMADGGLAEQMVAPAYMCIPYDNHVLAEHAALAEPLAVAVRAVHKADITLGSTVGIVGAGTVGLLCVQAARLAGARVVVAVERLEERRKLALKLGADVAVTPEEALSAGLDLTGGTGLDSTIEAAGNAAAAAFAVKLARRGGRTVLLGVFPEAVPLEMIDFLFGEKTVLASLSHVYDDDFRTAVDLVNRGLVELEPLITSRIGLSEVVERGFEALLADPAAHLKIIVVPDRR